MANLYKNKVVYDGRTIIDISDTTATADKIAVGYGCYGADGAWIDGTAQNATVVITEETDSHGGIIKHINTDGVIDLSNDTVTPSTLLSGATAHDKTGAAITGTYTPPAEPVYQSKTVSPTTSQQIVEADSGYDALSSVTVNAMPSGSATAPASIIGTSAAVSYGTNTLTLSKSVSVTPSVTPGYVASGTAGNSSISLTANVTTKSAATYNTSTTDQTIASGQYLTGTQTIKAVTTNNLTAANVKAGTTIMVGDANDADRIASVTGTYTSDATASAADIVSGQTAYVNGSKVTGSLVIQHYYTGSGTPSSSLGENGDIYLQTS